MKVLALDTCLGACSVAIFDCAKAMLLSRSRAQMEKGHAEAIAPMVRQVLSDAGLAMAEIGRIAVTVGPGSFTGVRIGLSLAQGLAMEGRNILVGLDTMRATASPLLGREAVLVCHKAGATGQAYVQEFSSLGAAQGPITMRDPASLSVDPGTWVLGTAASVVVGGRKDASFDLPDAAHFARLAADLAPGGPLLPLYIRDADAKPQRPVMLLEPHPAIAEAQAQSAAQLATLHAQCFYDPWPANDVAHMLQTPGTSVLMASDGGLALGFVMLRKAADECEILTLAVLPDARRLGLATRLLDQALGQARTSGITAAFLEVASDNLAALRLYEKAGFTQQGLRKAYYTRSSGKMDARILRKLL